MRVSMQTADQSLDQLRAEIQQLTAAFERKNGAVQTAPIVIRSLGRSEWNGKLVSENTIQKANTNVAINEQISARYATAPCLKALAKELGITVNSLTKRAIRLGVGRNDAAKTENHAGNQRAASRLETAEQLLARGQPVKEIAEKLNITPRQVRQYRQQIQQEAA
ncbi:MAG: helix-turn-helix domain-containing protein [Desulfuromonadaceae bacterium]|nr:helix-turn-helix domain-containing protein [Desulfuromonadaceae bacterium]